MTNKSIFPAVYRDIQTEDLVEAYRLGPDRIESAIEGLSNHDMKSRPVEGKWSIKEIIVHLADSEIMGAARIRQTFTGSDKEFAVYDQEIWQESFDYQEYSEEKFRSSIALFRILRQTTVPIFEITSESELYEKRGIHKEWGEMTLRQLLELYADHSERHIQQIQERRELLGKSNSIGMLLKKRLY